MNPLLRNILAVVAGIVIGSIVNMAIVTLGPQIIPNPDGFDNSDMKMIQETFHLLTPKHLLVPLLAHALGTLVGAFAAVKVAASHHYKLAIGIGVFFLVMGLYMIFSIPSTPLWFTILDLGSYVPMAWIGYKLAT